MKGKTSPSAESMARQIQAPRGEQLQTGSWQLEAPLRMLMNNLDPMVAEHPEDLVVYGGTGRAARNWPCYEAITQALQTMTDEETLLIQSGKPIGILKTHPHAPRVLIANSNLVGKWANWEHFNELEQKGLMMYGQMTAGSWIYIGSQGIVQGTYETFVSAANQHFNGELTGKWVLTARLGGMGGAQPLAAVMSGASALVVECDPMRIQKRLQSRYLDKHTHDLQQALDWIEESIRAKAPISVGLLGNAAEVYPQLVEMGVCPDMVTDQTSAHDPLHGYLPKGMDLAQASTMRAEDPEKMTQLAKASMGEQVSAMLAFKEKGSVVFDYGNNIRQMAKDVGVEHAFTIPGFVPAYIRPLFCEGMGPFRWVALSGDPKDIAVTDEVVKSLVPDRPSLHRWLDLAAEKIAYQGLPARICWLGMGERAKVGLAFNRLVREGKVSAPIVIGRDHLDSGSVASPNRETEGMKDGSDAVADWPLLNALVNTASGATWVSIHHGGGVGMGYSQHAGFVIVCDGSSDADQRLERVLTNDPAMGVLRHADADYDMAKACAKTNQIKMPMA